MRVSRHATLNAQFFTYFGLRNDTGSIPSDGWMISE